MLSVRREKNKAIEYVKYTAGTAKNSMLGFTSTLAVSQKITKIYLECIARYNK